MLTRSTVIHGVSLKLGKCAKFVVRAQMALEDVSSLLPNYKLPFWSIPKFKDAASQHFPIDTYGYGYFS